MCVYACVQVQLLRMGDHGASSGPHNLPDSKTSPFFKTSTNAHSSQGDLSNFIASLTVPLFPQLGKNKMQHSELGRDVW